MKYSKRVTDLQQIYQLNAEEVFFCMLVAAGASRQEAYSIIFRPISTTPSAAAKGANSLKLLKPGIEKCIKSYQNNYLNNSPQTILDPVEAYQQKIDNKKNANANKMTENDNNREDYVSQYRTKDAILTALESEIPKLRGKEKTDILIKIADLQRMKQEENKEEEDKTLYYLPNKCYYCDLFKRERERKDSEKS